ncbi:MAG: hydroxymethylbilane synthase [Desulfurococcales archaeon]|nr:hydroxymethylbilane synthase [Desulfurococcales archaeon]
MPGLKVRVATRGSKLSIEQVKIALSHISRVLGKVEYELVIVKTRGDIVTDKPIRDIGFKGVFEKEVNQAVLDGRADIAIHSMKDLPARIDERLDIVVVPPRGDPRDAIVPPPPGPTLRSLPERAVVGTSSARREALLLYHNDGITVKPLRGNLDTRLGKLSAGEYDYIVVSEAGLQRLGVRVERLVLPIYDFPPAPGQGLIAVVGLKGDPLASKLRKADDKLSRIMAEAERAFLEKAGGGCRIPVGGVAVVRGDKILFTAAVVSPDGSRAFWVRSKGDIRDPRRVGLEAGEAISAGIEKVLE